MEPRRYATIHNVEPTDLHTLLVQSIAVVSNPGLITIHSIQNGSVERAIPIPGRRFRVTGVWWFREQKKVTKNRLPEVIKRGENTVWPFDLQLISLIDVRKEDRLRAFYSEEPPATRSHSGRNEAPYVSGTHL